MRPIRGQPRRDDLYGRDEGKGRIVHNSIRSQKRRSRERARAVLVTALEAFGRSGLPDVPHLPFTQPDDPPGKATQGLRGIESGRGDAIDEEWLGLAIWSDERSRR